MSTIATKASSLLKDQRIRFLIVGGINTVLGYGIFVLLEYLIAGRFGDFSYMLALVIQYSISIILAFILHRRFVFQVQGRLWLDFGRFVLTNLVGFGLNAALLPLLVQFAGLHPRVAQAVALLLVTVVSYLGHKYFSFRRGEAAVKVSE